MTKLGADIAIVMGIARREGLRPALASAHRSLKYRLWARSADDELERRLFRETRERVSPGEMSVPGPTALYGLEYAATPAADFRRIVRDLSIDFAQFTFIDFGSGKGRVLVLAADLPFVSVVGVEFSPELHRIAEDNLARLGLKFAQSKNVDATKFEIPAGPCVFYFYNPFRAPVLKSVLDRIGRSYENDPRPMFVVYYNPVEWQTFADHPNFRPIRQRWASRLMQTLCGVHAAKLYRIASAATVLDTDTPT